MKHFLYNVFSVLVILVGIYTTSIATSPWSWAGVGLGLIALSIGAIMYVHSEIMPRVEPPAKRTRKGPGGWDW